MEANNQITTTEYLPSLTEPLTDPDRVSVRLDIFADGETLNFLMVDTTDWPPGSNGRAVVKDEDGNTYLVVERNQDRIFNFSLSSKWLWTFDFGANAQNEPITFKKGEAPLYKVTRISETEVEIFARARRNMPTGGARDYFNVYVLMEQLSGTPIALRIDPGTDNPPSRP